MANLPSGDIDAVHADIMRRYSSIFREIPVSKAQLRSFLVIVDGELEAAEIAIVQAVPAGPQRDWLIANDDIGRDMIELIEAKRKEVL